MAPKGETLVGAGASSWSVCNLGLDKSSLFVEIQANMTGGVILCKNILSIYLYGS